MPRKKKGISTTKAATAIDISRAHGNLPRGASHETFSQLSEPTKRAVDESSIQLLAYQIYQEKGGTDLDNWLEAEQSLKNDQHK